MEIGIQVKLPQLATTGAQAGRIIATQLEAATEAALIDVLGAVKPRTPANTGQARRAWSSEVYPLGTNAQVLGRVFNPLAYAKPLEDGARPHWPPFAPIALWVRRKLRVAAAELASVTFLVRRKIAQQGTKGAHMARDGWRAAESRVRGRYRVALRRINGALRGQG